ncbi:MAG: hypothetical protein U0521_18315 [Anaerolineae bacterium]
MSVRAQVGYGGRRFHDRRKQCLFRRVRRAVVPRRAGRRHPQTDHARVRRGGISRVSADGRWIVYVHHAEGVDGLALVDSDGALFPRKLAYGTDFVMQPAWHPDGTMVAYVAWNQPQMPWDGSLLQLAHLKRDADGVPMLDRVETLAGDTQTSRCSSRNSRRTVGRSPTPAIRPAGGSFICTIWRAGRILSSPTPTPRMPRPPGHRARARLPGRTTVRRSISSAIRRGGQPVALRSRQPQAAARHGARSLRLSVADRGVAAAWRSRAAGVGEHYPGSRHHV